MITDLGEKIIPYLKMCYEAARMWPDFDNRDMDSHEYVNSFDMEFLKHSQKEMQTKNSMSPKTVKITGTKETASNRTWKNSMSLLLKEKEIRKMG
ncbi:MAG: hypothetical protein ACLTTW_04275 [Coprobacter sp.]